VGSTNTGKNNTTEIQKVKINSYSIKWRQSISQNKLIRSKLYGYSHNHCGWWSHESTLLKNWYLTSSEVLLLLIVK